MSLRILHPGQVKRIRCTLRRGFRPHLIPERIVHGELEKLLKGFLLGFSKAKVILDGEDKGRVRRIGGIDFLPIESADDQLSLKQIVHALLPAHSRERDHPDGVFGRTAP